ncbi:MAG: bifunctional precorrin-2 dehydrogenase/sirohydrochlorin ferrochelatase [Syntrophotaleaceae bacterium]
MAEYPLLVNLSGRRCVVVGGGPVGRRKAAGLLDAGALVRLIDPQPPVAGDLPTGIELVPRSYRPDDLQGAFLVFAATGDRRLDRAVAAEARCRGALVNLPGEPTAGDFTLPAMLRRGDLLLSVSTAGRSPALAALLKEQLDHWLPPHWATVLQILAALRDKHLAQPGPSHYNRQISDRLLRAGLADLTAAGDGPAIDKLLLEIAGVGCSLHELAVELPAGRE